MIGGGADRLRSVTHDAGPGNVDRANSARVYDYFLGGDANFAVDREVGEAAQSMLPNVGTYARANRAFLGRVVRYLTHRGIDQFLDLGSGMPTVGNVHEAVQRFHPNARVVYVDVEPVVVAHARTMLVGAENVGIVQADIRRPDSVLSGVTDLLDLARPVAVLAVGALPFITDDAELVKTVSAYRARCVPGSFLAVSHLSPVGLTPEQVGQVEDLAKRVATPIKWRTREEVSALLDGYRLVDPGVVLVPDWRPDPGRPAWFPEPSQAMSYAAVGELVALDGS